MLTIDEIKSTVSRISKKYGVKNAYLFGSYAKDQATNSSDIDIIIDRGNVNTYDQFLIYMKNSLTNLAQR